MSVVFFHASMTLGHKFPPIQAFLSLGHTGWLGVEVFFALSGFLITRILLKSRHAPAGEYFGTFYYRRALRIFPLYFGVLALMWFIAHAFSGFNAEGASRFLDQQWWFWLHAANMSREFHGANVPALEFGVFELTHFWTLAVEEHFYLFWPLLVYALPIRWLVRVGVALIVLSVALRSGLVHTDLPWLSALLATPKYLAGLAIGGLAAVWLQARGAVQTLSSARRGAVLFAVLLCLAYAATPTAIRGPAFRTLVTLFAALSAAFAAVWVTTAPGGPMARFLSNRVLVTYGKYSYGIYVFHYLCGPLTRDVDLARWPGGYTVGMFLYIALYALLPLLVAMVSYRYWETPWLRLKDKHSYRPEPPPPEPPAVPTLTPVAGDSTAPA